MQYVRSTLTRRAPATTSAAGTHHRAARLHVRLAPLLLALALGTTPVSGIAAVPVPSSASTARHAADLRTYLDSIHWHEHALAQIPHSNVPSEREFFDAFAKATTPDEFYAKAMPIFESHIPAKEAHTLSLMASGRPVSPADKQAALEAFASIEEHAKPKLRHVWDALMDAFSQHKLERAIAEVRRSIADMAAHTEPDYIPSVGKVGLSYVDRMASLTVTLYARQWNASKLRDSRCAAAAPDHALAPATLLAPGGFAAAHRALDECERALRTQEATNEAAFRDFLSGAQAIQLVDQSRLREQMEQASLAVHERTRQLSQLHHQLLDDQRRLVGMMEVRREHVRIEDGQLEFDTDDDVVQVNRIVDDIVAHGEAINDFLHQVREDSPLLRGVDLHDDVSSTAKPVADVQ